MDRLLAFLHFHDCALGLVKRQQVDRRNSLLELAEPRLGVPHVANEIGLRLISLRLEFGDDLFPLGQGQFQPVHQEFFLLGLELDELLEFGVILGQSRLERGQGLMVLDLNCVE